LATNIGRVTGGEWQVFVRDQAGGDWWLAADVGDRVDCAAFGPGALYLLSRLDAPVLRIPLRAGATVAHAAEVVPGRVSRSRGEP